MGFSTLPLLCAALLAFWFWIALTRAREQHLDAQERVALSIWIGILVVWGVATSWLALTGRYNTGAFFRLLPGLWLPLIPTVLTIAWLMVSRAFRRALYATVAHAPRAFIAIHGLRIAAAGGIYKTYHGVFPDFFGYPVGIPDFLFGLSAVVLALMYVKKGYRPTTLIVWNLLGIAVILPAPLLLQLGLPGPLQTFTDSPDGRALFEYPMVLAPTLVVPLFITMNAIQATVVWLQIRRAGRARVGAAAHSVNHMS